MSETELNDSRSSANIFSSGASVSGQLSGSSDIDYYSIAVSAGSIAVKLSSST